MIKYQVVKHAAIQQSQDIVLDIEHQKPNSMTSHFKWEIMYIYSQGHHGFM